MPVIYASLLFLRKFWGWGSRSTMIFYHKFITYWQLKCYTSSIPVAFHTSQLGPLGALQFRRTITTMVGIEARALLLGPAYKMVAWLHSSAGPRFSVAILWKKHIRRWWCLVEPPQIYGKKTWKQKNMRHMHPCGTHRLVLATSGGLGQRFRRERHGRLLGVRCGVVSRPFGLIWSCWDSMPISRPKSVF